MTTKTLLVIAACAAGCAGSAGGLGDANRQTIDGPVQPGPAVGKYGRESFSDGALARAQTWVDQGVMYSFDPNYAGYRTDCSGLVSWAWQLPAPGHTTYSFAGGPWDDGASYPIGWDQLEPGDALNYPGSVAAGTGHIFLFAGWADAQHYGFYVYEEYNFGHPASYLYHTLDTNWTGGRVRDQYIPIRAANRPPPSQSPPAQVAGGGAAGASCEALGYAGRCDGNIAEWSQDGQCKLRDCPAEGTTCGFISASEGYGCLGVAPGGTTFSCADVGYRGDCRSNWLIWEEGGLCKTVDCGASGKTCGLVDEQTGNDCI